MQEVQAQNTVENYSTLNPFLELQMSHYVSSKGFRGSNMDWQSVHKKPIELLENP